MGIKPKGPLFLLHEVGRTEALLFANSKACNRRPVWKSASQTTNLFSGLIWTFIYVCIKANGCDAATIFCSLASNLQVEDIAFFENLIGCKSTDVCIRPFPCPQKKALAICVQSQNYSSSNVMLLSFSRNDYVAILNYSLHIPLNVKSLSSRKI